MTASENAPGNGGEAFDDVEAFLIGIPQDVWDEVLEAARRGKAHPTLEELRDRSGRNGGG